MGCAPYLQIFKAGKLVHTSAATLHVQQSEEELPFVQVVDGTVPFNINQIIQGDVLIRCRHLTFAKKRVSMFRAAFHTGYVPPNVLRLTKSQLDGACSDKRFPDEFFLDLVFEKVDAEALSKHTEKEGEKEEGDEHTTENDSARKDGKGPVVKASAYDTMLQGDSRFWDVIADKRKEVVKQGNDDPFWGPTVGRRRGEPKKDTASSAENTDKESQSSPAEGQAAPLPTFSIGNEFDFLPVADSAPKKETIPQRDSLMDALNALDEDEAHDNDNSATEEIVFGTTPSTTATLTASEPSNSEHTSLFSNVDVIATSPAKTEPEKTSTDTTESSVAIPSKPSSAAATTTAAPPKEEEAVVVEEEEDMDALLATTDDLLADLDLGDLDDDDDDDLDDLEAMLKM
jgi:C2 domain of PTEN tumour-suppressor protein